jgi:membrane protein DedA with SNARE-associated domain
MWDDILKAIPGVFVPSMLKLILGPLAGYGLKLNIFVTMIASLAGMMTIVTVITYSGQLFRQRIERFFSSTLKHGKVFRFIEKYGLFGVVFLTPLILMPIPGALLALGFQQKHTKQQILLYMLISGSVWSVIFTLVIYFLGHNVLPDILK